MKEKIYYHYCSVDTFYNIIQTSTLRLGNPLSMNDSAEIIWLLKMVKTYIQEKTEYMNIIKYWDLVEKNTQKLLQELDLPYILCLSKNNDVLSQWRSYADDGKGVSLGIDVNALLGYNVEMLSGQDIIYDTKEQINLLKTKINNTLLAQLEKIIVNKNEKEIFGETRKVVSHILSESVVCKNPAFQEENEFRISCKPKVSNDKKISEIKFRTDGEMILPYREICFYDIRHSIIKNITIGPKSKINNRNLWLLLDSLGFKWKVENQPWSLEDIKWKQHVKLSKATYR